MTAGGRHRGGVPAEAGRARPAEATTPRRVTAAGLARQEAATAAPTTAPGAAAGAAAAAATPLTAAGAAAAAAVDGGSGGEGACDGALVEVRRESHLFASFTPPGIIVV